MISGMTSRFPLKTICQGVILGCFVIGSLPLAVTSDEAIAASTNSDLPAALVLALADTCLGGGKSGDHRPCDKSACHAAMTEKRKKAKKQRAFA